MEELKVIMEALSNLGDGAQNAFIFWVLVKYALMYLITGGTVIALVIIAYKLIRPLILNFGFVGQIKSVMGYTEDGIYSNHRDDVIGILQKERARRN